MNPLHRIGRAVDRMVGLPSAAVPYAVRPDVGVPMPTAWSCSGIITGLPGRTGRFRWC